MTNITPDRFNLLYIDIAKRVAKMSRARRLQVGCVVVKDSNIISHSWNGTPAGWDNNCENEISDGSLVTKPEVCHAEMNAMAKIAASTLNSDGATMYLTHAPCIECAKIMFRGGIKKVVYENDYRSTTGVDFLRKCGVEVWKT